LLFKSKTTEEPKPVARNEPSHAAAKSCMAPLRSPTAPESCRCRLSRPPISRW
jgi:hypothetical protein